VIIRLIYVFMVRVFGWLVFPVVNTTSVTSPWIPRSCTTMMSGASPHGHD
jgi:hypothetical protein